MLGDTVASGAEVGALAFWRFYERLDGVRSRHGRWLAALGWGPRETPSRTVLQGGGFELKAYAGTQAGGLPILLVPAPIKQAYIWDLAPGASVVGACLRQGLRPYLVHWRAPEPQAGLAQYADGFLGQCLAAIQAECGPGAVAVAGHSLGGILATVLAALRPEAVGALAVLGAPLHFGFAAEEGALGPVIEAIDRKGLLRWLPGCLPGSLLSQAGFVASPTAFGRERWRDWLHSLSAAESMGIHLRVERWSLDEMPLAGRLVEDLVQLYRDDALVRGKLRIGGREVSARAVRAPLLIVGDQACPVVPPAAVQPFYERAASSEKTWLWYEGDVGVAIRHVGMLVGRNAHAQLWPQLLEWIRRAVPGSA